MDFLRAACTAHAYFTKVYRFFKLDKKPSKTLIIFMNFKEASSNRDEETIKTTTPSHPTHFLSAHFYTTKQEALSISLTSVSNKGRSYIRNIKSSCYKGRKI